MSLAGSILMLLGGIVAALAGLGLLRFSKPRPGGPDPRPPYARMHAAGKASPVAFLVTAIGAGLTLGPGGISQLVIAAGAMILTLPVGVHLLFRAVHRDERAAANDRP